MKHPPARVDAKGHGFRKALTTMQMCIMLVFVRPRVESRLTMHCEGLRSSLADCQSNKMSLRKFNDMMKSGPVVNVALEVGNRCWISWGLKGSVHVQVNVDGPEKCRSTVLAYARPQTKMYTSTSSNVNLLKTCYIYCLLC